MPITPFHFGPGAALHALAPRHVSFLAFCCANVVIDIESLYNLINRNAQVHGFLHTYVGATLVVVGTVVLFVSLRRLSESLGLSGTFDWKRLGLRRVMVGATLGAYSHIVLDSIMHVDIRPFSPVSNENALLGVMSLEALHWLCLVLGAVGLVGAVVRQRVRPVR
jgi:membrane-bound metal-dependent hydrolase YbcI (DUF457 family)